MFSLPDLPYAEDALAPHLSRQTMALHYGKHHKGYIDKLNSLIANDPMGERPLIDLVHQTYGVEALRSIFNNAAQSWNHEFFWNSMKPGGGGAPTGKLADMIVRDFGNYAAFAEHFNQTAAAHFGSGWVWLCVVDDRLEVVSTHDADLPLSHGCTILLCCDLWEHAYYIDYNNRRPEFVQTFLDHLVNWEFAASNLDALKEHTL